MDMIRAATSEELELVKKLLINGQKRMRASGNVSQWQNIDMIIELAKRDLEKGDCYLLWEDREALATFCFSIGIEPNYEIVEGGQWEGEREYGTLHRIASSGKEKSLGKTILEWAKTQCVSLRIDTHEDNLQMRKVIEGAGFRYVGIIYLEDGSPRRAYEWNEEKSLYHDGGQK